MVRTFFCSLLLIVASAAVLAQAPAAAFKPTHITVNSGGSGPDVILIPGLGGSRAVWAKEVPLLLPHYRLHLVQVDGFAGTAPGANAGMKAGMLDAIVSDLHQYIVANNLHSPAVVGHSLGGLLGILLAEQHPGDVGKLVILDTLPYFGELNDEPDSQVQESAVKMRSGLEESSREDWLKQNIVEAQGMAGTKDDQQKVALWSANSDRKVFGEAFYEDMITDARPGLAKLTIPILVMWPYSPGQGKESDIEKTYRQQWKDAPNVKFVKVDKSKHFIMLDQPQQFDHTLQDFLKS